MNDTIIYKTKHLRNTSKAIDQNGVPLAWLVSGRNHKNPDAIGVGYVTSEATNSKSTTAQFGNGAGFKGILDASGTDVNPDIRFSRGVIANHRIAPNGKPSKLNAKQYAEVLTPQFKAWFGDWEHLAKHIQPVVLHLQGWSGSKHELGMLARNFYSYELQGKTAHNEEMKAEILYSSEGKGTAFATSGNIRAAWKSEMVKALRPLIERAAKVAENEPDARRKHDTKAFHTLLSSLSVNGKVYSAK